jgi:hypothetical protein
MEVYILIPCSTDYARCNGFSNPTHFTDDGIFETWFDRPKFNAMMEEGEAGNQKCSGSRLVKSGGLW